MTRPSQRRRNAGEGCAAALPLSLIARREQRDRSEHAPVGPLPSSSRPDGARLLQPSTECVRH